MHSQKIMYRFRYIISAKFYPETQLFNLITIICFFLSIDYFIIDHGNFHFSVFLKSVHMSHILQTLLASLSEGQLVNVTDFDSYTGYGFDVVSAPYPNSLKVIYKGLIAENQDQIDEAIRYLSIPE